MFSKKKYKVIITGMEKILSKKTKVVNSESKLKVKNISLDNYLSNKIKLILDTLIKNKSLLLVGTVCATYKLVNVYYY